MGCVKGSGMNSGGVSKGREQFFLPGRVPFTFLKVLGLVLDGFRGRGVENVISGFSLITLQQNKLES